MLTNRTRSRGWTFTANIPEGEYDILDKGFKADYMVWQYEMVEHMHIQGYVYFANARTMSVVKKDIKTWCGVEAHLEKTRGTPQENKTYCTKEESRVHGPFEEGECPAPGARTDMAEFLTRLKENGLTEEIGMLYPQLAVQYGTKAEALIERWKYSNWTQRLVFTKPKVIVLWGDSGTGKTTEAMEKGACRRLNGSNWPWNDYKGHDVVLYDEFDGTIPLPDILTQIDGWPVSVPIIYKGNMPFIPKTIYICSNFAPYGWYGNGMPDSLDRRIDEIWHYTKVDQVVVKTQTK